MNITLYDLWERIKHEPLVMLNLVPALLVWLVGLGVGIPLPAIAATQTFVHVVTTVIARGFVTPEHEAKIREDIADDQGFNDGRASGRSEGYDRGFSAAETHYTCSPPPSAF